MHAVYAVVVLIATLIGALSGMGGGIIIKPALDFINYHDIESIAFYSSCAVLSMSLVNVSRQVTTNKDLDFKKIILVSIGSTIGGIVGSQVFRWSVIQFGFHTVKQAQSILLIVVLLLVVYLVIGQQKIYHITFSPVILGVGLGLGIVSSYLGVGGGPLNVAVFCILFAVDFKKATVYSLATIMFAQFAYLVTTYITIGFSRFNLMWLLVIIPAALSGGFLGSLLNHRLKEKYIRYIFNGVVISLILLNIYNFIAS